MNRRLSPFFSFFGSKHRLAPLYPAPSYDSIIEPFAGSACYSLLYPHLNVSLYDIDQYVLATWEYLIKVRETEILNLPLLEVGQSTIDLPICGEAKYLIGWWLGKGGSSPRKKITDNEWTRKYFDGTNCSYWGSGVRQRISEQLKYIRHWKIQRCSFERLPPREATWFIDPPYQGPGDSYHHGSVDHDLLGDLCRNRYTGQIIACEQEGADWLPFRYLKNTPSNNSNGRRRTTEVFWTNHINEMSADDIRRLRDSLCTQ